MFAELFLLLTALLVMWELVNIIGERTRKHLRDADVNRIMGELIKTLERPQINRALWDLVGTVCSMAFPVTATTSCIRLETPLEKAIRESHGRAADEAIRTAKPQDPTSSPTGPAAGC